LPAAAPSKTLNRRREAANFDDPHKISFAVHKAATAQDWLKRYLSDPYLL